MKQKSVSPKQPIGQAQIKVKRQSFSLDVNIEIPNQGVLGVFGHSGCGKTTLLRTLAGLEHDSDSVIVIRGQVWQDGRKVFLPPEQRDIGYVFQDSLLFPHLTVLQNLNYAIKRQLKNAAISYKINDVVDLLGINSLIGHYPSQLSGGEKQRVAIGRALLRNPGMLLLDEPLASLDHRRKQEVLPFIQRLHRELSIPMLYVSHSLEELMAVSDEVIALEAGRAICQGPLVDVMMANNSPFREDSEASTILECRVEKSEYGLSLVTTDKGNLLWIKQTKPSSHKLRVFVPANQVSLCQQAPTNTSILNNLKGCLVAVNDLNDCDKLCKVDVSGDLFISRISAKSLNELAVKVGDQIWIQFKSQSTRHFD